MPCSGVCMNAKKKLWATLGAGAMLLVLGVALVMVVPRRGEGPAEIRVLTDRTESHLAPIFAAYQKAKGVSIKPVHLDKGLVARLESRPTEADLVITKDADLLEIARGKGLLAPHGSTKIQAAVPDVYRDPSGTYFTDAYRARVLYYSKDRVKPEELSSYEALADKKWKGRVCIRSGYHDYNLSLFGQMMSAYGQERTRAFVEGLAANLARTPGGDDRAQVRGIYEGKCDVAVANSYYMGIMLSNPEQRPWGLSARVFFPNQAQGGTFILRSGLALTKATANVKAATQLLEYLVEPPTQDLIANLTFAYPAAPPGPLPEINQHLGEGQPGVEHGVFKIHRVPLVEIVRSRESVIRMLDEIQFDRPR